MTWALLVFVIPSGSELCWGLTSPLHPQPAHLSVHQLLHPLLATDKWSLSVGVNASLSPRKWLLSVRHPYETIVLLEVEVPPHTVFKAMIGPLHWSCSHPFPQVRFCSWAQFFAFWLHSESLVPGTESPQAICPDLRWVWWQPTKCPGLLLVLRESWECPSSLSHSWEWHPYLLDPSRDAS